jgi:hypothetical protein
MLDGNRDRVSESSTYYNETFYNNLALKLNDKHYKMIDEIKDTDINHLQESDYKNEDIQRLQTSYDYYLTTNLQNFGYLKTKKIINDINKNI